MSLVVSEYKNNLLTVLNKMIVENLLKTLLSVWSVVVVVIVSRSFIRVLDSAIEGRVSSETLLSILALKIVTTSTDLLPASLFMSVLMVLGKMYRDQEMSAIFSAGAGTGTIYKAVFLMVFPVSMMAAGLSIFASPWAEAKITQLMQHDAETSDLRGIAAGKFSEYSQGDMVFYVENITADKIMKSVFVQIRQNGVLAVINAQSARFTELADGNYLVFSHGQRVQGQPGRVDYLIEEFSEYAVRIQEAITAVSYNRVAIPIEKLWQSKLLPDIAEFLRRISVPIGIILLAFLSVPLAQTTPRGGVYGNVLIGFLIYFSYGNVVRVCQLWVAQGVITTWLGAFTMNFMLLLIGLILLLKLYGWRWVKQVMVGSAS